MRQHGPVGAVDHLAMVCFAFALLCPPQAKQLVMQSRRTALHFGVDLHSKNLPVVGYWKDHQQASLNMDQPKQPASR